MSEGILLEAPRETLDIVGCPLGRIRAAVNRFIAPSAASSDIRVLKLQIQLRRLALRDIAVIGARLQRADGRSSGGLPAKAGLAHRSYSPRARRGRLIARPG